MNLMKSFNFRYAVENLKKSKSILIFLLVIYPVLSILSIFASGSVNQFTLRNISMFHIIGICFIPIIISACLFGFIHKQKSIDFTLSVPLSRKTIFVSNTLIGSLFLVFLVFLCAIGIYVSSLFTPYIIPVEMILDYIFIWSITYIFVYVITNIAMSVTGNKITQIVVTVIILLLIPLFFDILFPQTGNSTICYEIGDLDSCYYGSNDYTTNFIFPYNIIRTGNIYNLVSFVKMIVIAIIGFFIGLKLFSRRKMEVNETSFEKLRTHNFVKALTMFPIIMLISNFIVNDIISVLEIAISLVVLIVYFVIYDFITRHSLSNIKTSILHFIVILVIMFPICILLSGNYNNYYIEKEDVKYIRTFDDIESYKLSLDNQRFSLFNYYEVKDKDSIKLITEMIVKSEDYSYSYENNLQFKVEMDGHDYLIEKNLTEEEFNELKEVVLKNGKRKTELLDDNYVYALSLGFGNYSVKTNFTSDKKVLDAAKEVIKKDLPKKDYKLCEDLRLYAYKNGKVYSHIINSCKSDVLIKYVEEALISENKKAYDTIKKADSYKIFSDIYLSESYSKNNNLNIDEFNEKVHNKHNAICDFILEHAEDGFSTNEDYIILNGGRYSDSEFVFSTNKVDEFVDMILRDDNYDTR